MHKSRGGTHDVCWVLEETHLNKTEEPTKRGELTIARLDQAGCISSRPLNPTHRIFYDYLVLESDERSDLLDHPGSHDGEVDLSDVDLLAKLGRELCRPQQLGLLVREPLVLVNLKRTREEQRTM